MELTDTDRALAPLLGKTLTGWARDSNMLTLRLGGAGTAGADASGAHTLYIFCPWRLARGAEVVAGSGDLYTPSDPDADIDTFDWEEDGATWWDARLGAFFEAYSATPPRVEGVGADAFGGFRLACEDGIVLDVFPNSSASPHVETEYWRLVAPGTGMPHMVHDTSGLHVVHGA